MKPNMVALVREYLVSRRNLGSLLRNEGRREAFTLSPEDLQLPA